MVLPQLFKDKIDENDLLGLIGLPSETNWLDIKQTSYTVKPDPIWKPEICEDIAAFANANGGIIVLGMQSQNGVINNICGLGSGFDADAEILRLKEVVGNGVTPLIPGVRFHSIELKSDTTKGPAIVIQIPRSFAAPHRVNRLRQGVSGSCQIFKVRRSNGNGDMSMDELRMLFNLAESYIERARNFCKDRIDALSDGSELVPVSLASGVKLVLHVVPLTMSDPASRVDLKAFQKGASADFELARQLSHSQFNFDGLLMPGGRTDTALVEYTQLFRTGAIEMVRVMRPINVEDQLFISLTDIEVFGLQSFERCLNIARILSVSLPVAVQMSIIGIQNISLIETQEELRFGRLPTFPRPAIRFANLLVPEVLYETYDSDYRKAIRPIFDIIWNTGGWAASENYDEDGEWFSRDR